MNPDSFLRILDQIKDHEIFKNRSKFQQIDPMVQLLVTLRRLGCEASSGAALISVSQLFGIGEGTVVLYTKRVVTALMSLWVETVKWHNFGDKAAMKSRLRNSDRGIDLWQDCVGVLDGTYFPFKFKPYPDERAIQYFNHHKKFYGLQATVICNDRGKVIYFSSIYPASVHDARCFKATNVYRNPGKLAFKATSPLLHLTCLLDDYFDRNEFLLADSAYSLTKWCITPYKTPRGGVMSRDHRRFNRQLSQLRIKVEHTIGQLKARFSFLRCIPNKGNLTEGQLREIYKWVGSAIVLHNLLYMEDPWDMDKIEMEAEENQLGRGGENYEVENEGENEQRNIGVLRRELFFQEFVARQE